MHLLRLLLTLLAVQTSPAAPFAPDAYAPDEASVLSCGTDEVHDALRKSDPEYARKMDLLEAAWAAQKPDDPAKSAAAPPYVLPIVFHIVHENGPENIADADVLRSVDFLNQALENTNYYDPATGVNTQIQVCLARRTPDNEATNGINRIVSPLTTLNTSDDRDLKDLSRWAPRDYINVWVVREACGLGLGCGLAGYAYYPGAHGSGVDGIVLEARWLADDEADLTVLVHELGHYLGVRHTFDGGCENDDCLTDGDRVCDTPPDQSTVAVPCTGSANSCSTDTNSGPFTTDQDDMHINYMDYGYFRCYSAFTAGQRERMHFFLEGTRRSLLESKGCQEPCPALVTAGFTGGDVTVTAGETINFVNTSTNGDRFEWRVGDNLISTNEDFSYLFDTEGFSRVRLLVIPADTVLCESIEITQQVRVVCEVNAAFNLPAPAPRVDSVVVFTNTSSGGDESEWTVDGTVVSTDRDLGFVFASSGRYVVCLTQGTGFCEKERCQNVFVRLPVTDPDSPLDSNACIGPFSYTYVLPESESRGAMSAVVARNDTIYSLLTDYGQLYAMALLTDGTILWQIQLFPSGQRTTPHRLIIDASGMLAGVAASRSDQEDFPLVFRINPQNGNLLWAKEFSAFDELNFRSITDPGQDGNYRITGIAGGAILAGHSFQIQLDREDGSIAVNPQRFLTAGSFWMQNIEAVNGTATGDFIMTGERLIGSQAGISVTRTDAAGNVLGSNFITFDNPTPAPVAFGTIRSLVDGDSLVIGNANRQVSGTDPFILRLCKTDINGIPGWTKDYAFPPATGNLISVRLNGTGYLSLLKVNNQLVLLQVDSKGEVVWCNSISEVFGSLSGPDVLAVSDDLILLAGFRSTGPATFPTIVRFTNDGASLNSCIPVTGLDITSELAGNFVREFNDDNTGRQLESQDFGAEPSNFTPVEDLTCREECPEPEEECPRPYLRTYGPAVIAPNPAPYEVNRHVRDGDNVIIAGRNQSQQPFVAALGPEGEVLWTRGIFVDLAGTVRALIIDGEGMVCGVGTAGASANGGLGTYAFRFDPDTGDLLWLKNHRRQGRSFVLSELIHTPGERFLRAAGYREADALSAISNGLLARIDLATGDILVPPTTYSDPGETSFRAFDKHPNSDTYYALANIQQSSAGTPQLARLNADGTVIFNKQYDTPEIGQAVGMVVKDTTVTILCERNGGGFVLVQTDTDGNPLWQKNYAEGALIHGITALTDGFLVWTNSSVTIENALIRLNEAGEIIWAYSIPGAAFTGLADVFHVSASATAITISTANGFSTLETSFGVIRTDMSGAFEFDCMPAGTPVRAQVSPVQTIVSDVPLELGETSFFTRELDVGLDDLVLKGSCAGDCPEARELTEVCDNGLDDDNDGLTDCEDPDLSDNCCCLDPPNVRIGSDQALCGDTRIVFFAAPNWDELRLTSDNSNFTLGIIRDFEPGFPYAFLLEEPGRYFFAVTDTCGKTGIDTLTLTPFVPPTLGLGPDVTVCQNATVTLTAQPGFASYEWTDGSTERTFTSFGEGNFGVSATDSCGNLQTDFVRVTFDPASVIDLGDDVTICPGDTLTFRLDGFTDIQWSQSSFIDCFDCEEVRFAPTVDTLLLVAATRSPGCFSSDSLRVRIKAIAGMRDTAYLCPGGALSFGNLTINTPGQYYDATDESRCPVVDTLDVFGLRDTLVSEEVTICAGDSVLVFGAFEREADTYFRISTGQNGCDSTNQVVLTVRQPVLTEETVSICAGDSALVFGVFERDPGPYFRISTGQNGCDSTHQVTLEVNEVSATAAQVRPDCEGADAGAGQVFFASNGQPVSILWSDGTTTALNENLAIGDYTVTVTTTDGCSATTALTITNAPPSDLAPAAAPESCPGENDGTIFIPAAPAGFTYQLDDGPEQTAPSFQNLAPGPYQLTVRDSFGCPQTYDLTVIAANELVFELPPDITVNLGDSIVLTPTSLLPATATINWLTDDGQGCPSCPDFTLLPGQSVTVTAIATDSSGCAQTRTTRITVNKNELFYVPNAFSPNGDAVNEVFRVFPGPAVESILSFAVYDRWGGQVFLREDVDPEDALGHWDGRLANGRDPAVGVYVYTLQLRLFTGEVIAKAGEVLVMR